MRARRALARTEMTRSKPRRGALASDGSDNGLDSNAHLYIGNDPGNGLFIQSLKDTPFATLSVRMINERKHRISSFLALDSAMPSFSLQKGTL